MRMNMHRITLAGLFSLLLASCGGGGGGGSSSSNPDVVNPGNNIAAPTATAGTYHCDYGTDSSYVYIAGNGHLAANGKAIINFSMPNDPQATINDTITWACQEHTGDIYGKYNTDHRADRLRNFSYRTTASNAYLEINYDSTGMYVTGIGATGTAPPQTTPAGFNFIYSYVFTFNGMSTDADGQTVYTGTYTCQVFVNNAFNGSPMMSQGTFRFYPQVN